MKRFFGEPDPEVQAIRREFWLFVRPFVWTGALMVMLIFCVLW